MILSMFKHFQKLRKFLNIFEKIRATGRPPGDPDLMQLYAQRYMEALTKLEELGEGYSTTDSYRGGEVRKPRS